MVAMMSLMLFVVFVNSCRITIVHNFTKFSVLNRIARCIMNTNTIDQWLLLVVFRVNIMIFDIIVWLRLKNNEKKNKRKSYNYELEMANQIGR